MSPRCQDEYFVYRRAGTEMVLEIRGIRKRLLNVSNDRL